MCLHLGEGGVSGRVYLYVVTAWYHLNKQLNPRKKRCTALDHCSGRPLPENTSSGRPLLVAVVDPLLVSRPPAVVDPLPAVDLQQWSTHCWSRPPAVVDPLLEQWPTTVPVIGHCV
ncbi:hypothetical protein Adt_14247 [Abeliophyllum distichum]|uniref:Uncharacterized protein n=1 Tax=Abeliophyllum distichum TaxID=126358 RepID=A0ABD1U028_9LAMI